MRINNIFFAIFSILVLCITNAYTQTNAFKPNIIYILVDDMGYGDLGCFGSKQIKTPILDKMAKEGLKLTRHYSTAVCAPSRATLMTGKHLGHCEIRGNRQDQATGGYGQLPLSDTSTTVPMVLKNAGYTTALIGKWGLGEPKTTGDPLQKGFDMYYGYTDQVLAHNHYPEFLLHNGEKEFLPNEVVYFDSSAWHKGRGSYSTKKEIWSQDRFSDMVNEFISSNKKKPFFIYYSPIIPHENGEAPSGQQIESKTLFPYENEPWDDEVKRYAASITYLDGQIGKLITHLKKEGLDNNTILFFVSDNGPINPKINSKLEILNSNGDLRGYKRDLYEGGVRVPFIAYGPGIVQPGLVSDVPTALWDFLPTVCELANINYTKHTDGVSMVPLFSGKPIKNRPYLYWELYDEGTKQAVLKGKWKAVRKNIEENKPLPNIELYNLEKDPSESIDVSKNYPKIIADIELIMKREHLQSQLFRLANE